MAEAGDILESDDVRTLVEIGFMALMRGQAEAAAEIFAGVVAARPAQEAGHIGTALVQLHRGDPEAAAATLRRLPPSDAARLFLGLAVSRTGRIAEARAILADVASAAAETPHSASARAMLDALPR